MSGWKVGASLRCPVERPQGEVGESFELCQSAEFCLEDVEGRKRGEGLERRLELDCIKRLLVETNFCPRKLPLSWKAQINDWSRKKS